MEEEILELRILNQSTVIKVMFCVEGNRSDCKPETNSIAHSRSLSAVVVDSLTYHSDHRA